MLSIHDGARLAGSTEISRVWRPNSGGHESGRHNSNFHCTSPDKPAKVRAGIHMASLFKRRLVAIFRPKHDYLPGTTIFRQIDIDTVADELELAAKGELDGQAGIPTDGSRTLSVAEKSISRRILQYWTEAVEGSRRAYESLYGRFASLSADTEIDTLIGRPRATANRVAQMAREERDTLIQAYEAVRRSEARFRQFIAEERPGGEVRKGLPTPWKIITLLVAMILELAVNTTIFSQGNEFGLAGALLKVIVIPVFNLAGTFVLVRLLLRHILRPWPKRAIGLVGAVLVPAYIVIVNLAVAHWRDSLSGTLTLESGTVAFARVFTHTFSLASDDSWILFGVGCAAALVAAADAWLWDDPHPGYARAAAACERARAAFDAERAVAIERIEGECNGALLALRDEQRKAETARLRQPELAAQVRLLAGDLEAYREHLVDIAEELAGRYREANLRARTAPAPAYFEQDFPITLSVPVIAPPEACGSGRDVAGLLAEAISEISEAEHRAKSDLPTLGELELAHA